MCLMILIAYNTDTRMPYLPKLKGRTNESFKRRQSIFATATIPKRSMEKSISSSLLLTSTTSKSPTSSLFIDASPSRQLSVVSGETDSVVKSMQERRKYFGQEEASRRLRANLIDLSRADGKRDIFEPEPSVKRVHVSVQHALWPLF